METKICFFLADKFSAKATFIGDIQEKGKKVSFNIAIKDGEIDIPKSCQVLNIDTALNLRVYIRIQVNKSELLKY